MEPRDCPELDRCLKLRSTERRNFTTYDLFTAAIEAICHRCDGPEEKAEVSIKKTYKLLAYLIKAGDEIDIEEGAVPLGTVLDLEGKLYAFILSPVYKVTPVVPHDDEKEKKEPEGEKDVNTSTTSPD